MMKIMMQQCDCIDLQDEEIIEVELIDNNLEPLDIDALLNQNILDTIVEGDRFDLDAEFVDLIQSINSGGSSSKLYLIQQNDTADLDSALDKLSTKSFKNGDILLIISEDKTNSMGYIYTLDYNWIAFSGNVSAGNTLFEKDILCAGNYTQVGNITKTTSGTVTIPAKGKTIEEVMTNIFTQELQPTKTEPSVNITFSQAGAKEVGTTITPSYTTSLNAGSYSYGPATNVTVSAWKISDSKGNTATSASGIFDAFVVEDNTNYTITSKASHTEGAVALTNIGNASNPIVKIAAGEKSKTSSAVTGYRCMFYGILENLDTLDSDKVRALTNGGKAQSGKITVKVNGNSNAKRICVILPTSYNLKVKQVMKTDGLATDITSTYSKTGTVSVDGTGNHGLMKDYDIWTYQPAKIDAAEVHEITIG